MAAYLGYTLWMKMLFVADQFTVDDTHTRRSRLPTDSVHAPSMYLTDNTDSVVAEITVGYIETAKPTCINIYQVRFKFIFGWKAESIIALIQYYTASWVG